MKDGLKIQGAFNIQRYSLHAKANKDSSDFYSRLQKLEIDTIEIIKKYYPEKVKWFINII